MGQAQLAFYMNGRQSSRDHEAVANAAEFVNSLNADSIANWQHRLWPKVAVTGGGMVK